MPTLSADDFEVVAEPAARASDYELVENPKPTFGGIPADGQNPVFGGIPADDEEQPATAGNPADEYELVRGPVSDNWTKSGSAMVRDITQQMADMGTTLRVLEDPGPLRNNFRNYQRTMIRAGEIGDTRPANLLGDQAESMASPEAVAAGQLHSEREKLRQASTGPGRAMEDKFQTLSSAAGEVEKETPGNKHLSEAAGAVGGLLPLLGVSLIPVVGGPAALAMGGAQSGGSAYNQAYAYYKQQGYDDATADAKALHIATTTGASSALLYAALPGSGKAMAEKILADEMPKWSPLVQKGVRVLASSTQGGLVVGADTLVRDAHAMQSYRPDLTWPEAIAEASQSAIAGGVAMGALHGPIEFAKASPKPAAPAQPAAPTEAEAGFVRDLASKGAPATAKAVESILKDASASLYEEVPPARDSSLSNSATASNTPPAAETFTGLDEGKASVMPAEPGEGVGSQAEPIPGPPQTSEKAVFKGSLAEGDTFKLNGEPFTVTGYDPSNDHFTITNDKGEDSLLAAEGMFHPDEGSLERVRDKAAASAEDSGMVAKENKVRYLERNNGDAFTIREPSQTSLEIESLDAEKARDPDRTRELQQHAAQLLDDSNRHAATLPRGDEGHIDFRQATDQQIDRLFDFETKLADARKLVADQFDRSGITYPPHSEFLKRVAADDARRQQILSGTPTPDATTSGGTLREEAPPQQPTGMGGATPSEFDKTTRISELTDLMSRHVSPETPLRDRFSLAQKTAEGFTNAKNKIIQGLLKAQARGRVWYDALTTLPEWTDFKNSLGKLLGAYQVNDHELRKWIAEVRTRIPDKLRREAFTNYIQAGGDEALLRNRANLSSPRFKRGYELAAELTPEEKVMAANIGQFLDARLREGINAGILQSGVENYINQVWDGSNRVTKRLMADFSIGKLNTNFRFARERIFSSYFAGEQAGFIPKSKDIAALIAVYDAAWNRSVAARLFIKQLNDGQASDGRALVAVSGARDVVRDPSGTPTALVIKPKAHPDEAWDYKSLNHPALRGWRWAGTDEHGNSIMYQGDLLVHPEVFDHLNNVLKRSELRQNEFTKTVLDSQRFIKQTKLSLSAFHWAQEGFHAIAHRVNPFNTERVNFDDPLTKELAYHGLQLSDFKAMEAFSEGVSGSGGLVEKIPVLGRLSQRLNDTLFQDYIPALKNSMAKVAFERNMERYKSELASGRISRDQLLELTANQANAAFGELNYKMMGRSPALKDFLRLTLLAPDFLEARARFVGQALKPYGAEQRAALALMAGVLYVGARALNKILDDDYHWGKPFSVVANGREYSMRSVIGDAAHLFTDPRSFAYGRLSFVSHTGIEFLSGRDAQGIKRDSIDQFTDAAKWLIPITLDKKQGQSWTDRTLSNAGITSKSETKQSEIYKLAAAFNRQSGDAAAAQQHRKDVEIFTQSDYAPLRSALQAGDTSEAKAAFQKLLATGHTPTTIAHYFSNAVNRPFTGSQSQEGAFIRSLDPDQKKMYQAAKQERMDIYKAFVKFARQPSNRKP